MKQIIYVAMVFALLVGMNVAVADDHMNRNNIGKEMSEASRGDGFSRVRAIHLSPDAPSVDIMVNGNVAISDLMFSDASDYARLPSDMYNIKVVPAGASGPIVIEADLELEKRKDYTVVAVNTLENIEPIVLEDWTFSFNAFRAMVRFVHASPDAPAVDIALKDGPVIFSNVEFKESTDYKRIPKGEYDLEVRISGTDTVVLDVPGVMVDNGNTYTIFAKGFASPEEGQEPLGAVAFVDRTSLLKR